MASSNQGEGSQKKINWKILSVKGLFPPFILSKDKYFIGRSASADIVLKDKSISGMHAALIINENKVSIVDLDSTNGIYVNKEKVDQSELKQGDIVAIGAVPLMLQVAQEGESNLSFSMGALFDQGENNTSTKIIKPVTETQEFTKIIPTSSQPEKTGIFQDITGSFIPKRKEKQVFRPTDIFPQAEYSAFIFEQEKEEEIVDVFVPAPAQEKSVEVVIMHGNFLLSINYLTPRKHTYYLTGALKGNSYVNVPFLDSKNKNRAKIIFFDKGSIQGFQVDGFKLIHFKTDGKMQEFNHSSYQLSDNEIYEYRNGDYKILLKLVQTPPSIMGAPFFTSDQFYSKLLGIVISLWLIMTLLFNFVTADKPEEKKPPKINRVIYKKKKKIKKKEKVKKVEKKQESSESTAGSPEKKQEKKAEKKTDKKSEVTKPKEKIKKVQPKPPTQVVKPKKSPPKKNVVKTKKKTKKVQSNKASKAPKKTAKAKVIKPTSKLKMSSLSGKHRNLLKNSKKANLQGNNSSPAKSLNYGSGSNGSLSAGGGRTGIAKGQGTYAKLTGKGRGQGSLRGSKGIGSRGKSGVGVSFGTDDYVVMGAIDPRVIQNLLRQYLPQFSFCYEKELERIDKEIRAVIKFDFEIGPTGRVRKAKYSSRQYRFSSSMKNCFTKVLRLIPFPAPKGGGTVRIQQPFNMEPRY